MDIDSLRNELEEHLKRNPDPDAPSGFRDRFDELAADIEAAQDEESKTELKAQLAKIRAEAEAAADCACDHSAASEAEARETGIDERSAGAAEAQVAEPPSAEPATTGLPAEQANEPVAGPESGLIQRYGLIIAAVLVALVVAIYFYR